MDNTISKLLEYFKHITRDIFVYVLSGLLLIGNILLIDILYNSSLIFLHLKFITYLPLIIITTAYILGHIIMGIMFICLEIIPIDEKITKYFNININQKNEIKVYKKNSSLYEYFIERQNQLYYLRWNFAGAFLTSIIINIAIDYFTNIDIFSFIYIIEALLFFILLILHYKTAKDYSSTISNLLEEY